MIPAGASHVAESVDILVLDHLADEFGAVGTQASDGVVDAFDCKHHASKTRRVRRCDRRFDLDQFGIAKPRQFEPPVPIRGPHQNDVDSDTFEPIDAVHPRALDRPLAFDRHAERGEKSNSGCQVVDDDADVVQCLDRHVHGIAEADLPTENNLAASPLPASPPLIPPATAIDRRPGENVECPSYFHARSCGIRLRQPRHKLIHATTDIS